MKIIILLLALVCGVLGVNRISHSKSLVSFEVDVHNEIIEDAIGDYVKEEFLEELQAAGKSLDNMLNPVNAGVDKKHNNDCAFSDAVNYIRDNQKKALNFGMHEDDLEDAGEAFGRSLHTIMDFYAHSNWVETGMKTLLDPKNDGKFVGLEGYKKVPGHDDIWILQGKEVPDNFEIDREEESRVVTVKHTNEDGEEEEGYGIMTGTAPQLYYIPSQCPESVSMPHYTYRMGVRWLGESEGGNDGGLNKDSIDGNERGFNPLHHEQARELATMQVFNELCRLLNMAGSGRSHLEATILKPGKAGQLSSECENRDENPRISN